MTSKKEIREHAECIKHSHSVSLKQYVAIDDQQLEETEMFTVEWVGLVDRVTPATFTLTIIDSDGM